jgi:nucleoside-diphosphate-sugar epimerase
MKVLITGGTGFTGSHLVRRVLSRGHEVHVLDNQRGIMWGDLEKEGAKMHLGSMLDTPLLKKLVRDCGLIYHLAAAFRRVNLPKRVYWQTNVDAMRAMLEISQAEGVPKIVYCSTQGVHGNIDNPPGNEDSPIAPEDYYQLTKYEGERVAEEFIQKGMDITTLRPTAIYGPGDAGRFLMIFRQVNKGIFPFFGKGTALYHPLYIDNFIDAFELAATHERAKGRTYLIADNEYFTIEAIVRMIADVMNVPLKVLHLPFWPMYTVAAAVELIYLPFSSDPPIFRRRADWFRQNRAFRIDRARDELGYAPQVGLRDGLTAAYQWYASNGYL